MPPLLDALAVPCSLALVTMSLVPRVWRSSVAKPSHPPSSSTSQPGDASGYVKQALNRINARAAAACVLLHRDDKAAAKFCAKYHLLEEMSPPAK